MSPARKPPPIQISWEAGAPPPELDEPELRRALATFLATLGRRGAVVSLLMAGDATLQALNLRYRGLDRPTDVLSWCYGDADGEAGRPFGEGGAEAPWGELALSVERAAAQARENGWALRTEVLRLLAHGCAHLAGFEHETAPGERVMKAVEVRLLAAVGLREIYPPDGASGERD